MNVRSRGSGILLHITSLPSRYGVGDMGPWSYKFADFLSEAGQTFWQILPLNPPRSGESPYHASSAFAGNPLLISPELMKRNGLLTEDEIEPIPNFPEGRVDYEKVASYKRNLFEKALDRFEVKGNENYERFCSENSDWLEDFALFLPLEDHFEESDWSKWPQEVKERRPGVMSELKEKFRGSIEKKKFLQFIFFRQWFSLKEYCNERGIKIFGDLPIYVDYKSADVWANQNYFKLDEEKRPSVVSGVPPDAFSETGQLWGHPIYDWKELKERGYDWWIQRFEHNLNLYDWLRIDHFRGFVQYWEVPEGEETAINGKWVEGPAEDLFPILRKKFPDFPFIAEDLGEITPDVVELKDRFGFPGMNVLIFGFEDDFPENPHLPHNFPRNSLACTGTHDTNTIRGWFENEASTDEKEKVRRYVGKNISESDVHREFVRLAMMSVSRLVSVPMQDLLGLGESSRMNDPGGDGGNWLWRLLPSQLKSSERSELREMTKTYGRFQEGDESGPGR